MKRVLSIAVAVAATFAHAQQSRPATAVAEQLPQPQATYALPALPPAGSVAAGIDQVMPLTPGEIIEMRKRLIDTKRAASTMPGVPPRPAQTSTAVDLSPGATPPIVRVSYGVGAVISFLDATGAPWPVVAHTNFNTRDFTVAEAMKSGHVLTISPQSEYGTGNLAVVLDGMPTPVTITLLAGNQKESDYRVDLRLPVNGPAAKPLPVPVNTKPEYLTALTAILDGVPPPSAKPVQVEGAGVLQAWAIGSQLFLRTRLTILSPKPSGREMSADGTFAYALPWSPVILATEQGSERTLVVRDRPDLAAKAKDAK